MSQMYLVFAILLYFPLILTDKIGSEGTEKKGMLFKYSFYRSLIGIAVGVAVLAVNKIHITFDIYTILTSLMFGVMLGACMLVTFYSMQVATVAVSNIFKAASVIIPCVFGAVFFGDAITVVNIIGIVTFLIAVWLIVSKPQDAKIRFDLKALLACMITNGLGSVSMQLYGSCVPDGEEAVFMFYAYCVQSLMLFGAYAIYRAKNKNDVSIKQRIGKKMWLCGIIGTMAGFAIQQIITGLAAEIPAVLVFPITMGSSIIMGVVVGWMCFKEKLSIKNIAGIILGIISLTMINLF